MQRDDVFDRETALREFLRINDIPLSCRPLMQTIILMAADAPDHSLQDICAVYAEQHGRSVRIIEQAVRNAIGLAWRNAATPSSFLFSQLMHPEEFVRCAVTWLREKETAFSKEDT